MASSPDLIPQNFRQGADAAAAAIRGINHVLVAAHVNPDGDAVGAMAACGWILQRLGKQFEFYMPNGYPGNLDFLKWPAPICDSLENLAFEPEAAIYVDCCESHRLGGALADIWNRWPSVNIDHHLCGPGVGTIASFIESQAAAACQLMAYVAIALDFPLNDDLAEAIALGLITDTGNFTHGNTTAAVFSLCAELEKNGCSIAKVGEKIRSNWTLARLRLWGALYTQARQGLNDRAAWSVIYNEELRSHGCTTEDLDGYIDTLRRMRDVDIALTVRQEFLEDGSEVSRFSLRSSGDISVQEVASALGGGGHKNASGGILCDPPWRALSRILIEVERYLNKK